MIMSHARQFYRVIKRCVIGAINRRRDVASVFEAIYRNNRWGGKAGDFFSGRGTGNEEIATQYIAAIGRLSDLEGFRGLRFLDLGCGDFRIGSSLVPLAGHYTAADIVAPLIEHHQTHYHGPPVDFQVVDMIDGPLPDADVCFIRQVFQHLSNSQIAKVLPKLGKFRWVFITEHLPSDERTAVPNLDKVHGTDIRLMRNSGVYLHLPPFAIPQGQLATVLEVSGHGFDGGIAEPGVIRTLLYRPQSQA
jgi:SAM-dependent methyltransferase